MSRPNKIRIKHQSAFLPCRGEQGRSIGPAIDLLEAEASDELDRAKTACTRAEARWGRLEVLLLDVAGELRRLDQIETETASLRSLAALFNAENPLRLDLETYAIGATGDLVADSKFASSMFISGKHDLSVEAEGDIIAFTDQGIRLFESLQAKRIGEIKHAFNWNCRHLGSN